MLKDVVIHDINAICKQTLLCWKYVENVVRKVNKTGLVREPCHLTPFALFWT